MDGNLSRVTPGRIPPLKTISTTDSTALVVLLSQKMNGQPNAPRYMKSSSMMKYFGTRKIGKRTLTKIEDQKLQHVLLPLEKI